MRAAPPRRVALTGAAGAIGTVLRPGLLAHGIALRSHDLRTLAPLAALEEVSTGDLRDPAVVDRVVAGCEVVLHLAGTSVERPLAEIIENNLRALHEVYEGARRHGVRRVVFASSNHAFGMHEAKGTIGLGAPFRPDGLYGLSKAWGESMSRLYWDKHGIEGISVRIGTAAAEPTEARHLSTWLGQRDMLHLALRCIEAEEVGCMAIWGVSANSRAWWRNDGAERLGYHPVQNAEDHASAVAGRVAADPVAVRFQGGSFAAHDYDRRDGTIRDM